MRILFLSQLVPFPLDAGPKVRSYHVLQYLRSAGHEVTLLAFERASDKPENIEHLRQFCAAVYTVPMVRSGFKDAWHLGRSTLKGEPFLIVRDGVTAMYQFIQNLVTKQEFDAIHADQLWMAQYALAAKTFLNGDGSQTKLVLDQHNAVYLIPERLATDTTNPLKRMILAREAKVLQRYELETCRRFDQVVWVSNEDRRALSAGKTRLIGDITVPICVDTEEKAAVRRSNTANRVTFLGGLHWPPNSEGVLWFAREVWPQIAAEMPNALLTIIGKAPDFLLTAETPIPNMDVVGYVEDVTEYLAETAVFIVPLHAGGGMRVKIVDAWSWGLPIVSTTIGAEGVRYSDGGNLLIGDSADDFAAAVSCLLRDPELADRISCSGRRTAETTYEWRKVYRAWDEIYG